MFFVYPMEYIDTDRVNIDITVRKKPERASPWNENSRVDDIGIEGI